MRFVLIVLFILVGCNTEEEVSKVPTGKGKIYGQLQERDTPVSYTHLTLPTNREV